MWSDKAPGGPQNYLSKWRRRQVSIQNDWIISSCECIFDMSYLRRSICIMGRLTWPLSVIIISQFGNFPTKDDFCPKCLHFLLRFISCIAEKVFTKPVYFFQWGSYSNINPNVMGDIIIDFIWYSLYLCLSPFDGQWGLSSLHNIHLLYPDNILI